MTDRLQSHDPALLAEPGRVAPAPRCSPTRAELNAAVGGRLPDILQSGLNVVFCGINPGLYSAAVGHYFARPGNRFWRALHGGGFTDRLWTADQDRLLSTLGLGLTNLVERATAAASDLRDDELVAGTVGLRKKLEKYEPRWLAVLGMGAYRTAFDKPKAGLGRQRDEFGGSGVWVLPNPSGLNAHYQRDDLARAFAELRAAST